MQFKVQYFLEPLYLHYLQRGKQAGTTEAHISHGSELTVTLQNEVFCLQDDFSSSAKFSFFSSTTSVQRWNNFVPLSSASLTRTPTIFRCTATELIMLVSLGRGLQTRYYVHLKTLLKNFPCQKFEHKTGKTFLRYGNLPPTTSTVSHDND